MVVQNVQEAINYIKATCATGMNEMGEKMKDIMKSEVMEQIYADHEPTMYNRSGQLEDITNIAEVNWNSVTVEFQDNGQSSPEDVNDGVWKSFVTGEHFFPLEGWEAGTVWKKRNGNHFDHYEPTTIMQESKNRCETEIPEQFKQYLRSKGLNVL